MKKDDFNQRVFNILFNYSVFQEFGNIEILDKKEVTQLEKVKIENCLNSINQFNQKLNEKFIQLGQNDQITN